MNRMNEQCPFCQIIESDSEGRILLESERAIAIRDGFPISEGHSLIIPKRHVASFFEISAEEQIELISLANQAKDQLDAEFQPHAYNVGINDGAAAGQTVPHLHIHLIPRYQNDVADPRGGIRWINPNRAVYWVDD